MAEEKKTSDPARRDAPARGGDAGQAEVQKTVDAENEEGFVGTKVDPTPNENYTAPGQASGAPTPETDDAAADEARGALRGKTKE